MRQIGQCVRLETTDGRFIEVEPGMWWDTRGTAIVPKATIMEYIDECDGVGIVVIDPNHRWRAEGRA